MKKQKTSKEEFYKLIAQLDSKSLRDVLRYARRIMRKQKAQAKS